MFGCAFVILIGIALKIILKSALLQHIAVFIEQSIVIGVVLSGSITNLCEVVKTFHWGLKRATHEISPRKVSEPGMLLHFLNSSPPQSLHWLPLQQFIGKVRGFNAPTFRDIPFRDYYLLLLNLLLYLLPRFA